LPITRPLTQTQTCTVTHMVTIQKCSNSDNYKEETYFGIKVAYRTRRKDIM